MLQRFKHSKTYQLNKLKFQIYNFTIKCACKMCNWDKIYGNIETLVCINNPKTTVNKRQTTTNQGSMTCWTKVKFQVISIKNSKQDARWRPKACDLSKRNWKKWGSRATRRRKKNSKTCFRARRKRSPTIWLCKIFSSNSIQRLKQLKSRILSTQLCLP